MSRGQIVFYALLALIALVMALGLTTLVWLVHLSYIAIAVRFTLLWIKALKRMWNDAEDKVEIWCANIVVVTGYLMSLTLLWGLDVWISEAAQKWIEAQ